MKNILFIYGPLGGGGAERVLIDILSNLDYSKYEVELCLMVNQGILLPEVPQQVKIIPLWKKYTLYYKIAYRLSIFFGCNWLFKRILKQKIAKKYDVEISFLEGMPLKLHALIESDAKKISWVHCDLLNFPYEKNQFAKNEELKAYNKMDTVVCVSSDTLEAFEKRFPDCSCKKEVIHNPIDIDKITALADAYIVNKEIFTIVIVGRLTPQKTMDRVLRLAAKCKNEGMDVHFRIVGDGELRDELYNEYKSLKLEKYVEFTGYLKNPYPYIKNADMLLSCSGYEGFSLVICEAMCLGVPVVSTQTAGPMEILDNNQYGLLCEHDDDSIFRAVHQMIKDEKMRNHYKKKGIDRVKNFKIENIINKIELLLE